MSLAEYAIQVLRLASAAARLDSDAFEQHLRKFYQANDDTRDRELIRLTADTSQKALMALVSDHEELSMSAFEAKQSADRTFDESWNGYSPSLARYPFASSYFRYLMSTVRLWLDQAGLSEKQWEICSRFRYLYVRIWFEELSGNPSRYQMLLKDANPNDYSSKCLAWCVHLDRLADFRRESILGMNTSLDAVYVSLEGSVSVYGGGAPAHSEGEITKLVSRWANRRRLDQNDGLAFLSAGPGFGKSTVLKDSLVRMLELNEIHGVFVHLSKLHLGYPKLRDALEAHFENYLGLPLRALSDGRLEGSLVIVLDGLDELSLQGPAGKQAASHLLVGVKELLAGNAKLKVLIAGRDVIVQRIRERDSAQTFFRLRPMNPTNQGMMWSNLNASEEACCDWADVREVQRHLCATPLGLLLLWLSYRTDPNARTVDSEIEIYRSQVKALHGRLHDKEGRSISALLSLEEYEWLLGQVAVAAWPYGGRTVAQSEVKQRLTQMGKPEYFEKVIELAEGSSSAMLDSFYFRLAETSRPLEPQFEFTQKRFSDYFIASALYQSLLESLAAGKDFPSFRHALDVAVISRDMFVFLREYCGGLSKSQTKEVVSAAKRFFHSLRRVQDQPGSVETRRIFCNSMALIAALASSKKTPVAFFSAKGDMERRSSLFRDTLMGSGFNPALEESVSFAHFLQYMDLSGQDLSSIVIRDGELVRTILAKTLLADAIFRRITARSSDLRGAHCYGLRIVDCEFSDCKFDGLIGQSIIMERVVFSNCSFRESFLLSSKFNDVVFLNCDLQGTSFAQSDLRRVRFRNCLASPPQSERPTNFTGVVCTELVRGDIFSWRQGDGSDARQTLGAVRWVSRDEGGGLVNQDVPVEEPLLWKSVASEEFWQKVKTALV